MGVVQPTRVQKVGHKGSFDVGILDDNPVNVVDVQKCVAESHQICFLLHSCVSGCDEIDGGQARNILCNMFVTVSAP